MKKNLYGLLPDYYRFLDLREGEPLKALFSVLSREFNVVEADIAKTYENWFIETCDEWLVPYIGDLLGVRSLHHIETVPGFSQRGFVANTLAYRRRKGTAPVLEQLALDIAGWRARVVEFFELLETTQNINHVRLHNLRTPDLRNTNGLELLDTAFDSISHTADVRPISHHNGWYNIPNIGLFLWRIKSYPLANVTPNKIKGEEGCFTFNPLGKNLTLFNRPATEKQITHLAEEINVPGILRRSLLSVELKNRRLSIINNEEPYQGYFNQELNGSVLEVQDGNNPIPPEEIIICNLEEWQHPVSEEYTRPDGTKFKTKVAVDPLLGRMALLQGITLENPKVSYSYGFTGDIGGGPYDRRNTISGIINENVTWHVGVCKETISTDGKIFSTLSDAINEWNNLASTSFGVISIMDNSTYAEELSIIVPEGSCLFIVAADWPETDILTGSSEQKQRLPGNISPKELRPHLRGNINIEGIDSGKGENGGTFIIDGMLIEGNLNVIAGNLGTMQISNSTIVPNCEIGVVEGNNNLNIKVIRSITGPIELSDFITKLVIEDSIVDNKNDLAISAKGSSIELKKSTVLGKIEAKEAEISDCIITEKITITIRQKGCARFSFITDGSEVPRRFRCQPDMEIASQISMAKEKSAQAKVGEGKIKQEVLSCIIPLFSSTEYGNWGYAQLAMACPSQIRTGAENGSEMGVFNFLMQPQREANLRIALEEYLPLGLDAGLIIVT